MCVHTINCSCFWLVNLSRYLKNIWRGTWLLDCNLNVYVYSKCLSQKFIFWILKQELNSINFFFNCHSPLPPLSNKLYIFVKSYSVLLTNKIGKINNIDIIPWQLEVCTKNVIKTTSKWQTFIWSHVQCTYVEISHICSTNKKSSFNFPNKFFFNFLLQNLSYLKILFAYILWARFYVFNEKHIYQNMSQLRTIFIKIFKTDL